MPVFLDPTKERKFVFRGVVLIHIVVVLFCLFVFTVGLFFGQSVREPIKYTDTIEAYHYYYSAANDKKIALTFDDGPRAEISEKLMDALEEVGVPATFFYMGTNVLRHPNLAAEAQKRGFTLGNHSLTHGLSVHDTKENLSLELRSTGYIISTLTGADPGFYRPPFLLGIGIDPTINPYLPLPEDMKWALENGYMPVGSDIDPHDWVASTKEEVLDGVKEAIASTPKGRIMLLHEELHTAEAIKDVVHYIREQGYTIVPLAELLTPPKEIVLGTTLARGASDATTHGAVSKLQWFLYQQGDLDPYLLTGNFGTETEAALTQFQLRNKLIDPTSIDPAITGVADHTTRELITTLTSAKETTAALDSNTLLHKVEEYALGGARILYVNLFPYLRSILIGIVSFTLVLVVARGLFFFSLLYIGHRKKKAAQAHTFLPTEHTTKSRGVSVLIPAYNEEENIRSTIESVMRSTYPHKEVIVIDDGSTDNTNEVVRAFIAEHSHEPIRLAKVRNGGKARALNHGIDISRFGICVVLDADAVLEPHALSYFVQHFADPTVGAVAGKVRTTGSRRFLDLFQTLEYAIGQNIDKRALSVIGAVGVVPGPAGAWDRSMVMTLGGFASDTLVEDQDMTLRLLRAGKKIIYEPDAIAYTETPHTITNFLKQRLRWIYGTMQCFWKNKGVYREAPLGKMSTVVMPNIFIFNILLPLTYPFADGALLFGLLSNEWRSLVLPFLAFTIVDLLYAGYGVRGEPNPIRLLWAVPLQRIVYRQLLYYTVARSVIRAIEGTGLGWNKFTKIGETQRFYFTALTQDPVPNYQEIPEVVTTSLQGPNGTLASSTNRQEVAVLSVSPRQLQSAGEISSPAPSLYVLNGFSAEPNTYAKSSSSNGPTSSH